MLQKKLERYDYFPFTHGYEIERKQRELNEKRKEEMLEHNEKKKPNRSMSDASSDLPISFYADYPIFLKPHKHYPYRRMKDGHV